MSERLPEDIDALPSIYRKSNAAITEAYQLGKEAGRKLGREEQAREHHAWFLNNDARLAEVAREARQFALSDAAEAWDSPEINAEINRLADQHYRAGGPSMPTIWLRRRAEQQRAIPPTNRPPETDEENADG